MPPKVRRYSTDDRAAVSRLVKNAPLGLVYHRPEFREFLCEAVGDEDISLVAEDDGRIVGLLPVMIKRTKERCVLNSQPWFGTYGGCLTAEPTSFSVRRLLLKEFSKLVNECGANFATVILPPTEEPFKQVYRDALGPYVLENRTAQVTRLPSPGLGNGESLMATLLQRCRRPVKKSLQQGFVEIVTDDDWAWDFLYEIHLENMAAIGGKPKKHEHLGALRRHCKDYTRLSVAMLNEEPKAALLVLAHGNTVEYIMPANMQEARTLQVGSFLLWNAMLSAIESGVHTWNWGGTWKSQASLHHFKEGWGAKDSSYLYLSLAKNGDSPITKQAIMDFMLEAPFYYVYPFGNTDNTE